MTWSSQLCDSVLQSAVVGNPWVLGPSRPGFPGSFCSLGALRHHKLCDSSEPQFSHPRSGTSVNVHVTYALCLAYRPGPVITVSGVLTRPMPSGLLVFAAEVLNDRGASLSMGVRVPQGAKGRARGGAACRTTFRFWDDMGVRHVCVLHFRSCPGHRRRPSGVHAALGHSVHVGVPLGGPRLDQRIHPRVPADDCGGGSGRLLFQQVGPAHCPCPLVHARCVMSLERNAGSLT